MTATKNPSREGQTMTQDTAYVERANGRWEAWSYSDGQRVYIGQRWSDNVFALVVQLERRGYRVVRV